MASSARCHLILDTITLEEQAIASEAKAKQISTLGRLSRQWAQEDSLDRNMHKEKNDTKRQTNKETDKQKKKLRADWSIPGEGALNHAGVTTMATTYLFERMPV